MIPALLTLARQLAALPGAPSAEYGNVLGTEYALPPGVYRIRDVAGLLWMVDPDHETMLLIDLADPTGATGGVLLTLVPYQAHWRITMDRADRFRVDLHDRPDLDALMQGDRLTLAAVAALAMIAHGRVGDV